MKFIYEKAKISDVDILEKLIEKSAKSINSFYYSESEINAALGNAWTVDKQLIIDKTYWIVKNSQEEIVGCGGWSKRRLLFGKSNNIHSNNELIPGVDSARIRAFFVHPNYTRMGIGKELLKKCETEAILKGFKSFELVATLSGEKLYTSNGYKKIKSYKVNLAAGITNKVISMYKSINL